MSDINISDYTILQLREWLRHLSLPTSGNKTTLVDRLKTVPVNDRGVCPAIENSIENSSEVDVEQEQDSTSLNSDFNNLCMNNGEKEDNREMQLLKKELELMKREKMLLKLENDLLKQQSSSQVVLTPNSQEDCNLNLSMLKDFLPEFDGSGSVELWSTQLKTLEKNFAIKEESLKALFMCKIKGNAQTWLHSKPDFASWTVEKLLCEVRNAFKTQDSKLRLRQKFEGCKWVYGENFSKYYNEKICLSTGLNLEEAELVEHLIEGISNYQLKTQATIQCFSSTGDLLRAFSNIELPKINVKKPTVAALSKSEIRCYNCNSKGHYANECKKTKREPGSCFGCGSRDHLMSTCPLRKDVHMVENVGIINNFKIYFNKVDFVSLPCLIDSGSPISFIQKRWIPEKVEILKCKRNEIFNGLNKSVLNVFGYISCFVNFNRKNVVFKLMVVQNESMGYDVVLGRNFMNNCNIKLTYVDERKLTDVNDELNYENIDSIERRLTNGKDKSIDYEKQISDIETKFSQYYEEEKCTNVNDELNYEKIDSPERKEMNDDEVFGKEFLKYYDIPQEVNSNILLVNYDLLDNLKINNDVSYENSNRFREIFSSNYLEATRPKEPCTKCFMKINLKDIKPFYCTPRRLSYTEKEQLQKLLDEYTEKGYIRRSNSEFTSPIVLVKKKNTDNLRLCIDFRALNKVTEKDNFPIPLVDDTIERLANKTIFTKLDLKDGFFHVFMDPQSVKFTSFVTPLGQFEFLRMPFGLKNAPSVFQRFINSVFEDLLRQNKITIYLDDIMIATNEIEEHFRILSEVLTRMTKNGLELRIEKCEFLQSQVKYLGYTISKDGIKADESGILAVKNFPIPKTVRSVQSFLGLCSYFRRFIKNFSFIAKPLHDLTRKDQKFNFGQNELNAFETLKQKLIDSPILAIYDPNDPIELHCDASAVGYGAILLQKKEDQKWHPVFYFSKRTTETEAKYHSFELETLSIIYALRRFRIYLQGKNFKILTDCDSLTMTLNKKEINPRISRWALELQNYDYIVEHRPGQRMQHVDALSRINNILVVESNSFEDTLIICQNKDLRLQNIKKLLEKSDHKFYEMRNGIVYRKNQNGDILFYVPESMESQVLYKYHNELGHMGIEKVTEIINKSYWFPKLKEKIASHIQNCLRCITFSEKTGKTEGFLHNIQKNNIPFETLHIDHIGPMANPKNSKKHLLVIVDSGTKFTRLFPTSTTKSKETIKALTEYFRSYSRPRQIVSDRGSCFTSTEFEDFMKLNNIQHIKVATGSPQANGQVERVNRSIGPMLAKLSDPQKSIYWDTILESVEYALNNTIHRTIKEHPSIMLFGVRQKGKIIDSLKENIVDIEQKPEKRQLDCIRAKAKLNEEKLQVYNAKYVNGKRQEPTKYKINDYVMIKNFDSNIGRTKKLIPKYKGPYKIYKILRNDRYIIKDVDGFQQTQTPYKGVWSVQNIKPWPYNGQK